MYVVSYYFSTFRPSITYAVTKCIGHSLYVLVSTFCYEY
jgi:hypothetical protein